MGICSNNALIDRWGGWSANFVLAEFRPRLASVRLAGDSTAGQNPEADNLGSHSVMNLIRIWISSHGWKALWVAIRRSRHDPHARKNLLRLLFSLLAAGLYVGWYVFYFRGLLGTDKITGLIAIGVVIGMVLLLAYSTMQQRWEKWKVDKDDPAVTSEIKIALHREACLLAILLDRLGSEIGMEKELPPSIEVITRRVQLEQLNALGLRDDLNPFLLDVLLAPDGHWTQELKRRAGNSWECLAVLIWALGIGELRPLSSGPKYDYGCLRRVLEVKEATKLNALAAWDLRPERNKTDVFFTRCWSELTARREIVETSDEDVAEAIEKRSRIEADGYTADYLIGAQTISELSSPILWMLVIRAYNRWQTLCLIIDIISGEKPASEMRILLEQFFSVSHTEEAKT